MDKLALGIDDFMKQVMDGFRKRVVKDLAEAITVPCIKCGSTHYAGTGIVVPCRDDDNPHDDEDRSGDHTHEVVWLCCMTCGQVYDTFEMVVAPPTLATGQVDGEKIDSAENAIATLTLSGDITPTEGDAEFVKNVHESVGYSFPGVRH